MVDSVDARSIEHGIHTKVVDKQELPHDHFLERVKFQNWADESVYQYVLNTATLPREHEVCRELRVKTKKLFPDEGRWMMIPPDEAQLLRVLVKISGAKRAIELGVMTGYSLLNIALALPLDGTVIGVDTGDEFEAERETFEKAGVGHKVDYRKSKAMDVLDALLAQGEADSFDFAFVDADKENFVNYYERLMKLVRVGGVIVFDNTLFRGVVGGKDPYHVLEGERGPSRLEGILALNKVIAEDKRVEMVMLSTGDGVTICNRIE